MTVTPCNENRGVEFGSLERLLKDLVRAQVELGREVFKIAADGAAVARDGLSLIEMPRAKSCCAVPEACWMPVSAGTVECHLAPEGRGEIHFTVANASGQGRDFAVRAAGSDAGMIQLSTKGLVLGAMERGHFDAAVVAPGKEGTYEALIWVTGCREHYLRVVIHVGARNKACCFKVAIEDKSDTVVHWYDHFYCRKPCPAKH